MQDVRSAFDIYKSICGEYKYLDRIPEIFTEDALGGNVACGHIQGLEALTIFYRSAQNSGLQPEDYLWEMIAGNVLAFRFRQYGGTKYDSPFFDGIGQLIFDDDKRKFKYYYGVFDVASAMRVMNSNSSNAERATQEMVLAIEATNRYRADNPGCENTLASDNRYVHFGE